MLAYILLQLALDLLQFGSALHQTLFQFLAALTRFGSGLFFFRELSIQFVARFADAFQLVFKLLGTGEFGLVCGLRASGGS